MPEPLATVRFVGAEEARRCIDGGAAVLDARGDKRFRRGHLPRAAAIDWMRLRDGRGRTGRLSDDDRKLGHELGERGVERGRPALVYGDGRDGSGEEGRIAWMLAHLGVGEIAILDGGIDAWRAAGLPVDEGRPAHHPPRTRFHPERDRAVRAGLDDVRAGAPLLDVRSDAEWRGAMPHLEPRGGRIPGARHLDWRGLFDGDGRLLSKATIEAKLRARGLRPDDELVVYCAGGVRSAFVWAALRALGWARVRMYDGSFFEWSKRRDLPLEAEHKPLGRRIAGWGAAIAGAAVATLVGARLVGARHPRKWFAAKDRACASPPAYRGFD